MIRGLRLSASLMCSSFANLTAEIRELRAARIDELHVDIMDGVFVPNYALGPDFAREAARMGAQEGLPVEVHLMVSQPERCVEVFENIGVQRIVFHVEATTNLFRLTERCRGAFPEVFAAINPYTPLSTLEYLCEGVDGIELMTVEPGFAGQRFAPASGEKIRRLKAMLGRINPRAVVEVDGAINTQTIGRVFRAGANLAVVGGSGLYRHPEGFGAAVDALEQALAEATEGGPDAAR